MEVHIMKRKVPYTDEEFETIYGERKVAYKEFLRIFSKAVDTNDDWHAGQTLIDKQDRIIIYSDFDIKEDILSENNKKA